jgi:hemerythrin-like domain-containing protein
MHMAHEMQRLRAEHAALATLSRFLLALVAGPDLPRATELASVRGMFRETLVRHLKCEDWALYPRLKASGDPQLAELAREFILEMGHIADEFIAYDARWPGERVAVDWTGFCAETEAVLDAIAMRIEREERELYPVAELYDEPARRRAARH